MDESHDEIDELVDWQLAKGRRGGDTPPPRPPAARTVARSVVADQPSNKPAWFAALRDALTFGKSR